MKKIIRLFLPALLGVAALFSSCREEKATATAESLTHYVDPYIGTGDHGHMFMGANVPFGFVQLGPTQPTQGWDWCSGYHISDSTIRGFGHLHLSGTGIGDLGDISFMPATGDDGVSRFSHDRESARPGYYSVHLERFGIDVELTATLRTGFHKYTFPASDEARIIIDLEHGIGWDAPVEGYLVRENDTVVSGYRYSTGWAKDQKVYFTAVFSKPMKGYTEERSTESRETYGQVFFDTSAGEAVYVKVGLSPVSIANAKLNLDAELPHWDFDRAVAEADRTWNEALNTIQVETADETAKKIFYTALYHTMVAPSVFCDVNGDYRGADGTAYNDRSFTNYTTFSLWDTYRAAHPLMTIIHPERAADIAATMLDIYNRQGKLPVWHLMGNETDCMVGNPGIPVLADLVLKGFDVDAHAALEAMKQSALLDERGLGLLKKYGYLPYDKEPSHETVAKGLEYALADWCVAQVAKKLGDKETYDYFSERSRSYRRYFDLQTQFMRGLSSDGTFREPFSPFHSTHRGDDYTEGNGWQYTWLVPHDVHGLIDLFGGEEAFVGKLDSLFIVTGDMGAEASPDISGLIGQYAHGNEPSHHVIYLYPYAGQQWKTAEKAREVMATLYRDVPAGLSGNEDVGQMSAWYILSAVGFYQVAPAGGVYVFGSPLFDRVVLKTGDNKTFEVVAHNNSPENIYIQHVTLNGKPYTKSYINHAAITAGGVLAFEMGAAPSLVFGIDRSDRP
ncbi:MAG: GH92 family glycosyl hydrolase [Tannerellaceae bacterium]|jgi:predicted alpha-1,2-mannosidase|nr:GH92 family glycosyl hydrolase [Tannerellaceae bacterium]